MTDAVARPAKAGVLPVLPPRFALVELAIFAIVIGCEYWIDAFPDLSRLNPHPYWIAVLLLSLQYGTVSGLLAAALAIGGSLLIGLPEAEIGESYFGYLIRVWTQPVLWLVVALLLGSFRMRQIEERHEFRQQADDATAQAALLAGYARKLKERGDGLERRLAALTRVSDEGVLDALSTLRFNHSADERRKALQALVQRAAPGATWSLFAMHSDRLVCHSSEGWGDDARWQRVFMVDTPLVQSLLNEPRTLSVLRAQDEPALQGQGLLAVPILSPTAHFMGMLKIEGLGSGILDRGVVQRVEILAPHLGGLIDLTRQDGATDGKTDRRVVSLARSRGLPTIAQDTTANGGNAVARAPLERG